MITVKNTNNVRNTGIVVNDGVTAIRNGNGRALYTIDSELPAALTLPPAAGFPAVKPMDTPKFPGVEPMKW